MAQLEWPLIIHEFGLGFPMKFMWEERARALFTYPNFWKQFYRKFPQYREASVTAREFAPGERVEVDYAGEPVEWYEIKTGEIHKAYVFASGLGFSQLLFAWAAPRCRPLTSLPTHCLQLRKIHRYEYRHCQEPHGRDEHARHARGPR
jgi:hypothetical protein